jgi:hypothetical protein
VKHLLLIPVALVAMQAPAQAQGLSITQENHHHWMRVVADQKAGEKTKAILNRDVNGEDGKVVFPRGSVLCGLAAKDGSGSTWDGLILPSGDRVVIAPFSIKGLLKEGE